MMESMKHLLSKFPYFLDKRSVSNFYKSESVFNNRFKEVYNDLFQLGLSFHLSKSLWIYREQSGDYNFKMHFFAFLDHIKQVIILKNDVIIYSKGYTFDENVDTFEYSYTDTSLNKIPTDKYVLIVETYDEYYLEKGFPENDEPQDNVYDHDESLDTIGLFLDVPRKKYINVDESEYNRTEPPYHPIISLDDGLTVNATEDDYHYMCRLLEYISRYHTESLPTLEIWKDLGVDAEIRNREYRLCKMFEESLHSEGWFPLDWEHKDPQCIVDDESYFLFVMVDNDSPFRGQQVRFTLQVLDSLGGNVTDDFFFLPFLDGERIGEEIIDNYVFIVDSSDLDMTAENLFRFKGFSSMEALENDLLENNGLFVEEGLFSDEVIITLKGCNDGDYYVALDGDDTGTGAVDDPFKTVEHAFSVVEPNDVVILVDEEYNLGDVIVVPCSCTLVSCAEDYSTLLPAQSTVFVVEQDVEFTLIGVGMKYKCCELFAENTTFWNHNPTNKPVIIGLNRPVGCKPLTNLTVTATAVISGESTTISGSIVSVDRRTGTETALPNVSLNLYLDDTLVGTATTNTDGEFTATATIEGLGTHTILVEYVETDDYCAGTAETSIQAYGETYLTVTDDGDLQYSTSYTTVDITYDENTSNITLEYDNEECSIDITIDDSGEIIVEDNTNVNN